MDTATMTIDEVITKVREVLEDDEYTLHDLRCVEGLEFLHRICDLHIDDARWGSHRVVIYALPDGVHTKYIGVEYYRTAGDGWANLEPEVCEYSVRETTTTAWVRKK